jgi:histidine triad (HIT) family protein
VVACERIGVSVIGLEVPHAHVHLVPINSISDLDFTKDRLKLSSEEFKELADEISANL